MIDCALMGVDWTKLCYWQYVSILAEWNIRHDSDERSERRPGRGNFDPERLQRAIAAHSKG